MKTAVYAGTQNLYEYMIASAKSLLIHSDVDQIYFLIEHDIFPYELPPKTSFINIANQTFFDKNGSNFNSQFTYMSLIRLALTKIFPQKDIVLYLDVDTIINENINELWDLNLQNYYIAAAKQPVNCTNIFVDINSGVMLMNLKKMREDKIDDKLIQHVNKYSERFPDQDTINKLCQGYILQIPSDYNFNDSTDYKKAKSKKIIHFAGINEWQKYPIFNKYKNIPNDKIKYNQFTKIGLDIIVPSYNDEKGLIRTLTSIYYPEYDWISIIVIDDNSNSVDYENILQKFPNIKLIKLAQNRGPGNARRVGMLNSSNLYLTFVDCGDIILSKYCFLDIKNQLENDRVMDIYEWGWIDGATNYVSNYNEPSTPGKVYRREFLEAYNIYPYNIGAGSFAAEDCSFNHTCFTIFHDYAEVQETPHIKYLALPIYQTVVNKNSITYNNNKEFLFTALEGVAVNGIYFTRLCEKAQVRKELINNQLNIYLIDLYQYFLRNVKSRPEYLEEHWQSLRKFYFQTYKNYQNEFNNDNKLTILLTKRLKTLKKYIKNPNIKRFLKELKTEQHVPTYYYENSFT